MFVAKGGKVVSQIAATQILGFGKESRGSSEIDISVSDLDGCGYIFFVLVMTCVLLLR